MNRNLIGGTRCPPPVSQDTIFEGDVMAGLAAIPGASIDCVVTSPPYWALRDYGIPPSVWGGDPAHTHAWTEPMHGDRRQGQRGKSSIIANRSVAAAQVEARTSTRGRFCECGAWEGQLGLEPTPELYIEHMVSVFREVKRVLKPTGTLWLNIGDSYMASSQSDEFDPKYKGGRTRIADAPNPGKQTGIKLKDMVGIPWTLALALRADGWYLRQEIIWSKANPMPESVRDRFTKAHEPIFLLSKSRSYYFDIDAVKEPVSDNTHPRRATKPKNWETEPGKAHDAVSRSRRQSKMAAAGNGFVRNNESFSAATMDTVELRNKRSVWTVTSEPYPEAHFATFPTEIAETCILAGCPPDGIVADPFGGSGTTAATAKELGRRFYTIEIKPGYVEMMRKRIRGAEPALFPITSGCGAVQDE